MKKLAALLLVLTLVLSMAACGAKTNGPSEDPAANETTEALKEEETASNVTVNDSTAVQEKTEIDQSKTYKDTIVVSFQGDAETLDVQNQNDTTTIQYCLHLFDTLVHFGADGTPEPFMVEDDYSISDDHLTWTFTLKEDLKFAKGNPLTTKDVVASLNRPLEDHSLVVYAFLQSIEKVEAVDERTFTITTYEPYGPMLSSLCQFSSAILDAEYLAKYDKDTINRDYESCNASGPYQLVSWDPGNEMVLVRNENYMGKLAATENLIFKPITDANARLAALETGEVDYVSYMGTEQTAVVEGNDDYKVEITGHTGMRVFRFGCNDPIISNTKVRQALVYAIDTEAINKALFGDQWIECTGPMTPGSFGYYNYGPIKQDLEKAKQLLAEAGYPDGFETKIVASERYAKSPQIAEAMAAMFLEIGVKAEVEVMEISALRATWQGLTPEEFDEPMFVMGLACGTRDADSAYNMLYTTTTDGTNMGTNYGFYSNAEVDELIAKAQTSVDQEERAELYKRAGEIMYLEDPTQICIHNQVNVGIMSAKCSGVVCTIHGAIMCDQAVVEAD